MAALGVWFAFRRVSIKMTAAALALASILASPYAFVYDLTLVAAGITLVATESSPALSAAELLVFAVAMFLPIGMMLNVVPPIATLVHLAVFAIIIGRLCAAKPAETQQGRVLLRDLVR